MSFFDWFAPALAFRGIDLPTETVQVLPTLGRELGVWWLLTERAATSNRDSLAKQFPERDVLPFARRTDGDDVACVVTRDSHRRKGSVIVIHDGAMRGYEVADEHADFVEWYAAAINE